MSKHKKTQVNLSGCTSIAIGSLQEGIKINGDLKFYDELHGICPLQFLPENIIVKGVLDLQRTGIKRLPNNFVAGVLDVQWCEDIFSIPENAVIIKTLRYNLLIGFFRHHRTRVMLMKRFEGRMKLI